MTYKYIMCLNLLIRWLGIQPNTIITKTGGRAKGYTQLFIDALVVKG